MEENSEAQMETDTSLSADTSRVQEVTGSHGNMETVIVVEELKEDEWPPESGEKHLQLLGEENTNTEATESTTSTEKAQTEPVVTKSPQKTTQLHLKIKSPKEFQMSPAKDLVVRTYSRSPVNLLKGSQISAIKPDQSPIKPDQSPNEQNIEVIAETVKLLVKKDLKSFKEQNKGTQKSPTKPDLSKDTQPLLDVTDCPGKISSKKDIKSPSKDKGSHKSPPKLEQCKGMQSLSETIDCVSKSTLKKDFKPLFKGSQKVSQRSLLKLEPPKDIQLVTEIKDCSNTMTTNKDKLKSEKQQKGQLVSEDSQVLNSKISPTKTNSNEPSRSILENPLLLTALSGQSLLKKNPEANKPEKSEEGVPVVNNDCSIEIVSVRSNDFTQETNTDSTETHNKSISRELKSLIKSAKESKIISECTQLTTKTRKSRGALDISNTSSTSMDLERPVGSRRNSDNSLLTNSCSEVPDKTSLKRSMRSQNPEFVNKVKLFLNSVTGKISKSESEVISEEEIEEKRIKDSLNELLSRSPKKKKSNETESSTLIRGNKIRSDPYCWRCHWAVEQEVNDKQHTPMMCTVCPRSFHYKCLSGTERSKIISEKNWVCPECLVVLHAESSETRSPAMKKISLGSLCELLKHALDRMMDLNGVEPFMQPVDRTSFPDYDKYVVHPMDLLIMKNNINEGLYGSTEAFLADAQWILHNSIIFNTCDGVITVQSKLTAAARALVRSCKVEMGEIEACPECYAAAHSRRPTWFTDVCTTPHMLLWAKLKGFPYWPAKCMSVSSASLVDVRFFGAHDRAWVPARDCFLYCEKDPNNFRTKRQDILDSMQEAEQHIRNISRKYGKFVYPPFKTQLDPTKLTEQLKMMIPTFEGEIKAPFKDKSTPKLAKNKSRSSSKGSKGSSNDGEISDGEETKQPRKMADGAEIAMDEDFSIDKDTTITPTEPVEPPKEAESSRKRRRSELEEAVITIMEGSTEKRKCVESEPTTQEKQPEPEAVIKKAAEETLGKQADKKKDSEVKMIPDITPLDNKDLLNNSLTPETKRPPIKMILKRNKCFKTSSPKEKSNPVKSTPFKLRVLRIEKKKITTKEKRDDKVKSHKRRNSKNKLLNSTIDKILIATKNDENKISAIVDESTEKIKNKIQDDTQAVEDQLEDNDVSKSKGHVEQKDVCNSKPKGEKIKNNVTTKSKDGEGAKENINTKSKELIKSQDNNSSKADAGDKLKDTNGKINKDSPKVKSNNTPKYKETVGNIHNTDKNLSTKRNSTLSTKTNKEPLQFDEDNTSLAVIARESSKRGSLSGLPTISSVRSLSSPQTVEGGRKTPIHKVVDNNTDSNIFIPTSTDTVKNMKEAVTKLNKLRNDNDQSLVGKVGVCAFARMPSTPPAERNSKKTKENVEIEIKSEPIDFDDADRQVEKLHLMNSFSLRPVSTTQMQTNPREIKVNKITAGPPNIRKIATKPPEPKSRAKKTLQQQKKVEDGRSELNSKNSMVYIPIQPPVTQAPVRMTRPVTINGNSTTVSGPRSNVTIMTNNSPAIVNTPPSTQVVLPPSQAMLPTTNAPTSLPASVTVVSVTSNANTALQSFPTVGPVPTTLHSVHTVPLITSVNGQWTFSLQPIMSVGGLDVLDDDSPSPVLNGLGPTERNSSLPAIMPPVNGPVNTPSPVIAPKPMPITVVSTNTPSPKVTVPPLQPLLHSNSPLTSANRTASEDTAGTVGEPPRLQHKPLLHPFDVNTPLGTVPPPSTAGPITAKLNQNAIKLTDFFRTILEDTIERLEDPVAEATGLKLQLEETRWRHQQEIDELKHNHELVLAEMRATFEKERVRAVNEARRAAQVDLEAAVKVTKSKQWCANCSQEAQFYCCWNTSYCDYSCQRTHWSKHYAFCVQQRTQDSNTNTDTESVNSRLQSPSENLPKTTNAPTLSKAPVARVFNQDQSAPKSIIVSMVEDRSGNTTVKCVGTYKPSALTQAQTKSVPAQMQPGPAQMPPVPAQMPIIVNKPVNNIINNDEAAAKKVVTSGGYLIVGAPNTTPLVTPPRRPQTIQYFS